MCRASRGEAGSCMRKQYGKNLAAKPHLHGTPEGKKHVRPTCAFSCCAENQQHYRPPRCSSNVLLVTSLACRAQPAEHAQARPLPARKLEAPLSLSALPGRGREALWLPFGSYLGLRVNRKNGLPRNLPPPMFIPIESGSTCQNNSPVFGGVWAIRLTPPGTLRQTALATALAEYPAISLPGETRLYGGEPWWGEVWGEANFSDSP